MKSKVLWALVALNVLLGVGLAVQYMNQNTAQAQARRPGEYLMIPGEVVGVDSAIVYIADTVNGQLTAVAYDDARKEIGQVPVVDLGRIFAAAQEQQNTRRRR